MLVVIIVFFTTTMGIFESDGLDNQRLLLNGQNGIDYGKMNTSSDIFSVFAETYKEDEFVPLSCEITLATS